MKTKIRKNTDMDVFQIILAFWLQKCAENSFLCIEVKISGEFKPGLGTKQILDSTRSN